MKLIEPFSFYYFDVKFDYLFIRNIIYFPEASTKIKESFTIKRDKL